MKIGETIMARADALRRLVSGFLAWRRLPVGRRDLVLDVGSGNDPHVRADVLCDAFLADSGERPGGFDLLLDGRPFVFTDACRLPFKDHAFDFIVCRHLLEHMHDPRPLLGELMRVGRAGYIECPSSLMEHLRGWSFHRLLVDCDESGLLIRPKTEAASGLLPKSMTQGRSWQRFCDENPDRLLARQFWIGSIGFRLAGEFPEQPEIRAGEAPSFPAPSVRRRLRWLATAAMRRAISRHGKRIDELLECPKCRGSIETREGAAHCASCAACYPIPNKNRYWFLR